MSQLGELVHVGLIAFEKGGCPFCSENASNQKETIEMIDDTSEDTNDQDAADDGPYSLRNDSGKLAQQLGAAPQWKVSMQIPSLGSPPYIDAKYFVKRAASGSGFRLTSIVCANAHHLIPGNASFGRATQLLKWMGDSIVWKRVRYKATPADLSPQMKKSLRRGNEVYVYAEDDDGNMDVVQRVETSPGRISETSEKQIKGRVVGKVTYEINSVSNGVWLPSNNAVVKWSGLPKSVQDAYVTLAVTSSARMGLSRQFHDAHKDYSNEVLKQLNDLAAEVEKNATACMADKSHSSGNCEPLPAPGRLATALNAISRRLKRKVISRKSSWSNPWRTSQRAG